MGRVGCQETKLGAVEVDRGSGSECERQGVALRTGCLTGCRVQEERYPGRFLGSGSGAQGRHCRKHGTRPLPVSSVRPHASSSLTVRRTGLRSVASQLDVACSEQACPLPASGTCTPTNAACMLGWPLPRGHTRSVPEWSPTRRGCRPPLVEAETGVRRSRGLARGLGAGI